MVNSEFKNILTKNFEEMTINDFINLYKSKAITLEFLFDLSTPKLFSAWKNSKITNEILNLENLILSKAVYVKIFLTKYPQIIRNSFKFGYKCLDKYPLEGIADYKTPVAHNLISKIKHKKIDTLTKEDVKILYKFKKLRSNNFEKISNINQKELWNELALEDPIALKSMPLKYFDKNFSEKCFEIYGKTSLIPKKYQTQKMLIEENIQERIANIINLKQTIFSPTKKNFLKVQKKFLTPSMYEEIFQKNPLLVSYFPKEAISKKIITTIFNDYPNKIKDIPPELLEAKEGTNNERKTKN